MDILSWIKKVSEHFQVLQLEIEEISSIVYRNEDLGIGNRHFKHIDIELTYGECVELHENDPLYRELYNQCKLDEVECFKEVILYQKEP